MQIFRKVLVFLTHSFFLIVPGGITALGLFLFASGRFNPIVVNDQAFFLNLMQLQALGIVVSKFGIDQVVFSRLKQDEYLAISVFFKRRVVPIAIIYSLLIAAFYNTWHISALFIITLPLEVYSIILITEHNVNRRFKRSFYLMLLGYPLIFICIIVGSLFRLTVGSNALLVFFFLSSLLKALVAGILRVKGKRKNEADYTIQIPIQQITNVWMFRSDQLIVAAHLYTPGMSKVLGVTVYLFMAKLPEICGSLLAYLAPLLYIRFQNNSSYFAMKFLLKDRLFWVINFCISVIFTITFFFLDINHFENRALFYMPFFLHCLLVLPANLTTYMRFKSSKLRESNFQSSVAILVGSLIAITGIKAGSPIILAFSVPIQLFTFIALYQISFVRKSKVKLG